MYIYTSFWQQCLLIIQVFQFTIVDMVEVILLPIFHYSQLNEWVMYIHFKMVFPIIYFP